jgi:hypothetical protein
MTPDAYYTASHFLWKAYWQSVKHRCPLNMQVRLLKEAERADMEERARPQRMHEPTLWESDNVGQDSTATSK